MKIIGVLCLLSLIVYDLLWPPSLRQVLWQALMMTIGVMVSTIRNLIQDRKTGREIDQMIERFQRKPTTNGPTPAGSNPGVGQASNCADEPGKGKTGPVK